VADDETTPAAPTNGSGGPGGRRLLIAAGAVVADVEKLPVLVRSVLDAASDILVITPVLPSRLQWLASDTDRARHHADARLDALLGQFEEMDLPAAGRVGDETPLTALDDAVRDFAPDHILIALRSSQDADWQEQGLLDQVRRRFGLPLTVFVVADE
jgi:hypothetical protein